MKKTIGKRTTKVTKEAQAKKLYQEMTIEQKNELYMMLGKIVCGEIRNFYSTKVYKTFSKDLTKNQMMVLTYICRKTGCMNVFENMEELNFTEE